MSFVLPVLSLLISYILGVIVTKRLSIIIPKFTEVFFVIPLGIVLFTATSYFLSLIFSFPTGIQFAQALILIFEVFYVIYFRVNLNPLPYFKELFREKLLIVLLIIIGTILFILFNHHILLPINGDLYTGESTYGDLPFHLSTISQIVYTQKIPPDNPFFVGTSLIYPYLINFFSAILVYEGLSLRLSIIIPGLLLSISLLGLIYDFSFIILKSSLKSFLTVILYFFNGGIGFYYFFKDYSFNLGGITSALSHPSTLKEYSHLFEQNIQWANFLSRMIVPERSILFGIPIGIIILRLLFFKDHSRANLFDLFLASFLLSLMILLHTHTALVMAIIIPIITFFSLGQTIKKEDIKFYLLAYSLAVLLALPHISLFLNHVNDSNHFIRLHLGWMSDAQESLIWFWFKNTYLLIPLSLCALFFYKLIPRPIRLLQLCAFVLLVILNLILFSPYDWDNGKFLFWIGLFFDISIAALFGYFLWHRGVVVKVIILIITITMILSGLLSIWREINVSYLLFSKEALDIGEEIKSLTPQNVLFLTYKIHNSPVNNLAGRQIMMGYPGLLWVHGINYQNRDRDINKIFSGDNEAAELIEKYNINYVVLENYQPEGLIINNSFFANYPTLIQNTNYTIYQTR